MWLLDEPRGPGRGFVATIVLPRGAAAGVGAGSSRALAMRQAALDAVGMGYPEVAIAHAQSLPIRYENEVRAMVARTSGLARPNPIRGHRGGRVDWTRDAVSAAVAIGGVWLLWQAVKPAAAAS